MTAKNEDVSEIKTLMHLAIDVLQFDYLTSAQIAAFHAGMGDWTPIPILPAKVSVA